MRPYYKAESVVGTLELSDISIPGNNMLRLDVTYNIDSDGDYTHECKLWLLTEHGKYDAIELDVDQDTISSEFGDLISDLFWSNQNRVVFN